ncbi:MAG TPA: ABC transporter permease [Xanthobacteraceae bacterium]|nr:ABC transporter permease [Xanthobacteraceae bacterium]
MSESRRAAEAKLARDYGEPMVAHVHPILPDDTVSGRSLLAVVAIMSFLAGLTIGAVEMVHAAAGAWRGDMLREVTVQLRPMPGRDLDADTRKAAEIAKSIAGVADARAFSKEETERLLQPWLGNADLGALPVPRLVQVKVDAQAAPDFDRLRRALAESLPNAGLDDHHGFAARLAAIADAVTLAGLAVLALVLAATMLSVSFATRGAVAANRTIVEVLHFVGARDAFVARIFARHFLAVGLKGGLIGGGGAAALFGLARLAAPLFGSLPGEGAAVFLGRFALNMRGFLWIAAAAAAMSLITALSSRITVHRTLRAID